MRLLNFLAVCKFNSARLKVLEGTELQDIKIYNQAGLLMTAINVKLFDQDSERLGPVLELTIDPQKRIFESFDRTNTLFVSIAGEK